MSQSGKEPPGPLPKHGLRGSRMVEWVRVRARQDFFRWVAYTRGFMAKPGETTPKERLPARETGPADLELVREAIRGSPGARDELARRLVCVPRMLAALNARWGRPIGAHDLEDLTQDVLVALWRAMPSFAGLASLESWAFRACYRALLARLRRPPQGVPVANWAQLESQARTPPGPDDGICAALERITPKARLVIELKHYDELTFDEIGAALAVPPNTAKSWYYRSIADLKRMLARGEGGES
jgi:RNA polymerase sigma-70 factor (ECF subfamily)